MTDYSTPPDASRDGLDTNNNRATAPNPIYAMSENLIDKTATAVPVDSTTHPEEIKDVVQECGEDSHCVKADGSVEDIVRNESKSPPDPFDPASLRINTENTGVAIKKIITTIRCDKPNRHDFVRVRAGDEWRLDTMLLEENGGDTYLVDRPLHDYLAQECFPARLVLAITRSNTLFLWRLKLPRADGQSNHWNDAALVAAQLAETKWVRIASNMTAICMLNLEIIRMVCYYRMAEVCLGQCYTSAYRE